MNRVRYRTRRLAALIVAIATVAGLAACTGSNAVDSGTNGTFNFSGAGATALGTLYPVAERKKAADFTATLLTGAKFSLASTHSKVVVLNYWASWCIPCQTETPQFDLLYRKIKSRGVDFVGINTKNDRDAAQTFVRNNDITFPIVYDEPGRTAVQLGNLPQVSLPFTVLLDKLGRVAAVYVLRLSPVDLQSSVDKLLAEH